MCISYQLHPEATVAFYITDVTLPPIIFGVGIMGNLLLLLILNRQFLRRDSAIYVYLTGVAVVDIISLLCTVPKFIQNVDVFSVEFAHSKELAYAVWTQRGVSVISRHSAAWFTTMVAAIRFSGVQLPSSPARWARISASRIVAFILFVFCILLNFTQFLDNEVIQLTGHCFTKMSLWSLNTTTFGANRIYRDIHPVISVLVGQVIPLLMTLILALLLLCCNIGCTRLHQMKTALCKPEGHDEREHQVSVTVFAVSIAFLCLESPLTILDVTEAFFRATLTRYDQVFDTVRVVAQSLSLVRCSVNFVLIALLNYDFRKTFRRTFCCCCESSDDEFYEPVTCSPCCQRQEQMEPSYKSTLPLIDMENGHTPADTMYESIPTSGNNINNLSQDENALWI